MNLRLVKIFIVAVILGPLLLIPAAAFGQDEPGTCVEMGGLAYDNWTKVDSGGTGALPDGAEDSDYVRCKACHGWDHMGIDGGYVRRGRDEGKANAGEGDGDMTSRNISFAVRGEGEMVTPDMVWHQGTGRAYSEGKGSWVELGGGMGMHQSQNKADHSNGYTLGNQHPDFSTGGMTQAQVDCLAEFLNFADADPMAYFSNINPSQDPVLYTMIDTADAAAGEMFYGDNCFGCHGDPAGESPVGDPDGGILVYLGKDGKFSEFSHKARWGIPGTNMDRVAMGSPTSTDVADMMLWLQEEGGTGFAVNSGLSGHWWNGLDRNYEGFMVDISDDGNGELFMFISFYARDPNGDLVWLFAQGNPEPGAMSADLAVFTTTGGTWGMDYDPTEVTPVEWGTSTFGFPTCYKGNMVLTPNADRMAEGYTEIAYDLKRDLLVPGVACPTPTAN